MDYQFAHTKENYADLASGRVLYHAPGTTAFPVRLASEIIQRCFHLLEKKGKNGPYSLYDPCCGGAYLLTTIGLLHGQRISKILASDSNKEVLKVAAKNLSLLTLDGLKHRREQLMEYIRLYGKSSHHEALASAQRLIALIQPITIDTICFQADITQAGSQPNQKHEVDIVLTDLPYGDLVRWQSQSNNPIKSFFDTIYEHVRPSSSLVAVIADKGQKLKHEHFKRLQYFKVGKRQVAIFEPIERSIVQSGSIAQ